MVSDGTTHIVFTPHELIEKLIPLIPRPRCHLVRYHGILGPAAKDRAKVVPTQRARLASDAASAEAAGADKAGEGESRDIDAIKIYQESAGTSRDEKTTRYLEGRSSRFLFVIGGVVVSNVYTCRVALRSAKVLEGIGIGYVWCYGASE